jgi:hypothetical protein
MGSFTKGTPLTTLLTPGNSKLKKARKDSRPHARRRDLHVYNFNQPAFETCPGHSEWCREHCYADKGFFPLLRIRHREAGRRAHRTKGLIEEVMALPKNAWVRPHAAGDFDTAAYILKWKVAAQVRPDVRFWAYTRSWRVRELVPFLEELRALPNFELFASIDPSIHEMPPEGWRVAWIEGDERARGLVCPEQTGKMSDCADCGYCVIAPRGDLILLSH